MKKILLFLILLIGGGTVIVYSAKDWILKQTFVSAVRSLTGFETEIQRIRLDPVKGIVHLEGLRLINPEEMGFIGKIFGDAPEIYLEMDLSALLKKESVHFRELRLDVSQLNIEKNRHGVSNVSLLNPVKRSELKKEEVTLPEKKMPFQLDRFELTLRRVSYNDRSGIVPKKLGVDLHVNRQVFEGITDAKSIIQIIVMKVISASPLANLGVNVAELQDQLKDKVRTAREVGEKIYHEAKVDVVAAKTTEVGVQVLEEGTQTIGQVTGVAKKRITSLLGKARSTLRSDEPQTT